MVGAWVGLVRFFSSLACVVTLARVISVCAATCASVIVDCALDAAGRYVFEFRAENGSSDEPGETYTVACASIGAELLRLRAAHLA